MDNNYGVDVLAFDDLPDPEVLGSGEINRAYALARCLIEPPGVHEEAGDPLPYDCIDLREHVGTSQSKSDLADLEAQAASVLRGQSWVRSVDVRLSFVGGAMRVEVQGLGADGPFSLVLSVTNLTATILEAG